MVIGHVWNLRHNGWAIVIVLCALLLPVIAVGHNLSDANARFVQGVEGSAIAPFLYLGAKHMVTGVDHLLYLFGVLFFLRHLRDVLLYVTLFTLGHSITLVTGVLFSWNVDGHLVDTVIGLSVVYKAFENIGGFKQVVGFSFDARIAVFIFGLCHGLGLATKLQALSLNTEGLIANIVSFNLGVEIGQALALVVIGLLLIQWRRLGQFDQQAFYANGLLMCLGFILTGYQFAAYLWGK